jgi:hypothetical protein
VSNTEISYDSSPQLPADGLMPPMLGELATAQTDTEKLIRRSVWLEQLKGRRRKPYRDRPRVVYLQRRIENGEPAQTGSRTRTLGSYWWAVTVNVIVTPREASWAVP